MNRGLCWVEYMHANSPSYKPLKDSASSFFNYISNHKSYSAERKNVSTVQYLGAKSNSKAKLSLCGGCEREISATSHCLEISVDSSIILTTEERS